MNKIPKDVQKTLHHFGGTEESVMGPKRKPAKDCDAKTKHKHDWAWTNSFHNRRYCRKCGVREDTHVVVEDTPTPQPKQKSVTVEELQEVLRKMRQHASGAHWHLADPLMSYHDEIQRLIEKATR